MKNALRSALIVSLLTLAGHLVLFCIQIATAAFFGASGDMDAYLAASTLPSYIVTVLFGSIGFVFIPFFINYKSKNIEHKAYELALNLLNVCLLILGVITLLGILFARPILQLTAPGLGPQSINLAVKVAVVTWPTILVSGPVYLLASIYQAEKKFFWQAVVPLVGAVANLVLLFLVVQRMGVVGLALATTFGVVVQVFLLTKILTSKVKYKPKIDWHSSDLRELFRVALPMISVAIVTKSTPIIDRYFASNFNTGSISHLNYAYKIATVVAALISIGGSTVIFPRMALDVANNNINGLRSTISQGVRLMWAMIAPVVMIGTSLAMPAVSIFLKRGEFGASDVVAVADILKIYLFAVIGMALGNVTTKGFYALKETKILAMIGFFEALAYGVYTYFLARYFGVIGIAAGCVLYFTISIIWQFWVLNLKTGGYRGAVLIGSFLRTSFSAGLAGLTSYSISLFSGDNFIKILSGGLLGVICYLGFLKLSSSQELELILNLFKKKTDSKV